MFHVWITVQTDFVVFAPKTGFYRKYESKILTSSVLSLIFLASLIPFYGPFLNVIIVSFVKWSLGIA